MTKAPWVVLAAALCIALSAAGMPQDEAPRCAQEGEALTPASEDLSPMELEETARRILGPDVAQLVRELPWDALWRGDPFMGRQAPYFLQSVDGELRLPSLRFALAAPPPLALGVELRLQQGTAACVPFDVPDPPQGDLGPDDGYVTLRAPMTVRFTLSAGGVSERWELTATEATVAWQEVDGQRSARLLLGAFDSGELDFGLPVPGASESATTTWETLKDRKELAPGKAVLVRSLAVPGAHRTAVATLLGALGAGHLSGESWVQLRQLQQAGRLQKGEVQRLGLLARSPMPTSTEDAALFTYTGVHHALPPRLFVGGQEVRGWARVGERFELRAALAGLVAVRQQFDDGEDMSFVTVLGRGVHLRLSDVWEPVLEAQPPGPRCGLVRDAQSGTCGHLDEPAPVGRVFDLKATCGGMPAAEGHALSFGANLVPALPGLYVRDRERGLTFDPTYGGRKTPPAACGQP